MKNIDSKESNMAKGVNIATEFNEFKDTLFNKKVVRHKMKRIQSKKQNGAYEINKEEEILTKRRDSHRRSKIYTSKSKCTQMKISFDR